MKGEPVVREQIEHYFTSHRSEFIESIRKLITVRSVKGEALQGRPFGEGPAEALKLALELADSLGLRTANIENYVGTVEVNDKEAKLGILAHLDVVPEGSNWTFDPYAGTVQDGKIFGRGATDDKGPAVAALYALAAVKELGIPLKSGIRLILGTDEESGFGDIRYYFSKHPAPPHLFTPDGEFPVLNTEKGGLHTSFEAGFADEGLLPAILYAKGGSRSNVVPAEAEAVIEGLDHVVTNAYAREIGRKTGAAFKVTALEDGQVKLTAEGVGTHAAGPGQGINAVTALIALLTELPFPDSTGFRALRSLAQIFPHGDYYAHAAGIAMQDEVSGKLTLNFGIFDYTPVKLYGFLDCRTPVCATEENTMHVLAERLEASGIQLERSGFTKAHHTPADSPFVQTLLAAYTQYTGLEGGCESIGGWTYVHGIDGAVCFGATMPDMDTRIHGADEFAVIDDLLTAAQIYTQVIIDICSRD
ncbi:Sapep family Mn(2+)-dependent dipeptidase [Paenibacillus sp. P46E]|uniref:Sapep family Mn(2+)-dependent dipeptidase n=1 Tax=Paenibacillus sp. P46E TaxID=1349436 RepID=UPI00093D7FD0|nr:Sapep family Mn(2+)-dependent dipeptidase [Paenibacillus sp. P46E]OKP95173.1 dipeptidase [Paenibacillus sp. P46E]